MIVEIDLTKLIEMIELLELMGLGRGATPSCKVRRRPRRSLAWVCVTPALSFFENAHSIHDKRNTQQHTNDQPRMAHNKTQHDKTAKATQPNTNNKKAAQTHTGLV